ncbi:conserved Plasmodium protein, unknown function [Plasmodium malariae]|uniref:Uncharacterized protein n=1 Tax=Plasmodium malariae TaxID=5858 RepID=A0A1A8WWG1_PLAMA|nr:conserved Plasmodium protein, unknown function [Plasmodium malariae]
MPRARSFGSTCCYYDDNTNKHSFLKSKRSENAINIKREIEQCEKEHVSFRKEISKFIDSIKKENRSNMANTPNEANTPNKAKESINTNDKSSDGTGRNNGHLTNSSKKNFFLFYKNKLNRFQKDNSKSKENKSKIPLTANKEELLKNAENLTLLHDENVSIVKGNTKIHMLYKNNKILTPIIFSLNEKREAGNSSETETSSLYKKKLKIDSGLSTNEFCESTCLNSNIDLFDKKGYDNNYTLKEDEEMCSKVNKKSYEQVKNKNEKINKKLRKKDSIDSTTIIDIFIKNIEEDECQNRKNIDFSSMFSLYNYNNYDSYLLDSENFENYKMITSKNKDDFADNDVQNILFEYEKLVKGNRKILVLLFCIFNKLKIIDSCKDVNRKIEKGIRIYIHEVKNIVKNYEEFFTNQDNKNTQKLHYYFKRNEIVLLKNILLCIIDLMSKIKYECRVFKKEVQKEIRQVEEVIYNANLI